MALELFPGMYQAQVVAVASCVVVAFIVVFLSVPSRGSAVLLPLFGLAWLASLPFALFVLELSSLPPLPADMVRLHPDVAEGVLLDQLRRSTVLGHRVAPSFFQLTRLHRAQTLRFLSIPVSHILSSSLPPIHRTYGDEAEKEEEDAGRALWWNRIFEFEIFEFEIFDSDGIGDPARSHEAFETSPEKAG